MGNHPEIQSDKKENLHDPNINITLFDVSGKFNIYSLDVYKDSVVN